MSKRPPNELESRLHQAVLTAPKQEITAKQAEKIVSDANSRQSALNFLLGIGLLKALKDAKGNLLFRAVAKSEMVATSCLSGEDTLVFNHIKTARNEGIWTKHLKAKTNLHQTVIERSLKILLQRSLIKRVPSVQHPTRKIYMLYGLEPSIALTGGPWYTDNELDTEFIQHLTGACLKFIQDVSYPKCREGAEGALYPISNAPEYPTAQHIRNCLKKARLTTTELTVEHVESLLNVLVLDGKVEKLPSFGAVLWDSKTVGDGDSDNEEEGRSRKKKKRKTDNLDDDEKISKKKREKNAHSDTDRDSDDASFRKKTKRKRMKDATDDESDSDSEPKKKKKKRKKDELDESDASSDVAPRRKEKKKAKREASSDESSSSDSESDDDRSRRRKTSKAMKRSPSPFETVGFEDFDTGSAYVYRAVKEEPLSLGWSEAPCNQCPSFEFCKDGGPVNPGECVYYGEWLATRTVAAIEDEG